MNLSFLVVSWFLTFGYVPVVADVTANSGVSSEEFTKTATIADVGLKITAFDDLFFYTSITSYQYAIKLTEFCPFSISYKIGVGYDLNKNIRFNLDHVCQHPVVPNQYDNNVKIKYNYNHYETKLTITLHGDYKL